MAAFNSIFILLVLVLVAPKNTKAQTASSGSESAVRIVNAFPNLQFSQPIYFTHAGDASDRVFVLEKTGKAFVFENNSDVSARTVFFDITDRLIPFNASGVGETGLLSMAFHPDYANNGKLYISYVDTALVSTISEVLVSTNPDSADLASERKLLQVQQPQRNHNGGHIAFGLDGMLYIAFGDGFSEAASDGIEHGDPQNHGQNPATLLSSLLRIDVDQTQDSLAYAIPVDNPFVGNQDGWREETYAYGLRNPWRFSFDRENGNLWLADVGDKKAEEINLIQAGDNCGWKLKEAFYCFEDLPCDTTQWVGLADPIFDYLRDEGESITGGYVYRGERVPELKGKYIYGDFDFKHVWALEYIDGQDPVNERLIENAGRITSFGEDEAGEIYIVDFAGKIWTLEQQVNTSSEDDVPDDRSITDLANFPNPFDQTTTISFRNDRLQDIRIDIYDAIGRKIERLADQSFGTGEQRLVWGATNEIGLRVPSGFYFYVIETESSRMTGTMHYLR